MKLKKLPYALTVAKYDAVPHSVNGFYSLSVSETEVSLVAETQKLPEGYVSRADGLRAFVVIGPLAFSLVGVLARLSAVLAANGIPLFAVSTYDTDYLLVKDEDFARAELAFRDAEVEVL